jgi:hypothetical protein
LNQYDEAIGNCLEVLRIDKKNIKAVYRIAFSYFKKDNFDKTQLIKKTNEDLDHYFKRIKLLDVSRFTSTLNLKEDSVLKDFLLSEPILSIAESYLDTRDFSINATFFVSNPLKIDESEKYKNAQYFHWDNVIKNTIGNEKRIRDLEKFPGNNKAIEFLVKELINPIIIDKYE